MKRQRSNPRKPAFCCIGCQPWQNLHFQNFLAKLKKTPNKQLEDLSDLAAAFLSLVPQNEKKFFLLLNSTVGALWDVPACQYMGMQFCSLSLEFPDTDKMK